MIKSQEIAQGILKNNILSDEDLDKILEKAKKRHQKEYDETHPDGLEEVNANITRSSWLRSTSILVLVLVSITALSSMSILFLGSSIEAITPWKSIIAGVIMTFGIIFALGFRVINQTQEWVVTRLGKLHKVHKGGITILLIPGVIDHVEARVATNEISKPLYHSERSTELTKEDIVQLDFTDDSARVSIVYFSRVVNSAKFAFSSGDAYAQIEDTIDSALRTVLQSLSIDAANVHNSTISLKVLMWFRETLEDMYGVRITKIAIQDIDLSEATINQRRERLKAYTEAQVEALRGLGIFQSIEAIIESAKLIGIEYTREDAEKLYLDRVGLDTIAETGANINFISPDANSVVKTLQVTKAGE